VKEGGGWIRMELENNKRKTDGTTGSAVAGVPRRSGYVIGLVIKD